jgi:hypothetical protein
MMDFEKFPADDLKDLRAELLAAGLDSFQVAELIAGFLNQRGYGVSTDDARAAAALLGASGCAILSLQEQLEKLAYTM